MLNILRKNKENFIIKFILFLIIASFIIFFGSDTLKNRGDTGSGTVAVNGTVIPNRKIAYLASKRIDSQKKQYSKQYPAEFVNKIFNDDMKQRIYNATIEDLIVEETLRQHLAQFGLKAKPQKLSTTIEKLYYAYPLLPRIPEAWLGRLNSLEGLIDSKPSFTDQKNKPNFDSEGYISQVLPWYKRTFSSNLEQDLSNKIMETKFFESFDHLLTLNDKEIKRNYNIINTKFDFEVIKIAKNLKIPVTPKKEEKDSKAQNTKNKKIATKTIDTKKLSKSLFTNWKDGVDIKKTLKENKLQIKPEKSLNYMTLKRVFSGEEDIKNLKTLSNLTPKAPFPSQPLETENFYYLVRLTKKETPKAEDLTEENKNNLKKNLENQFSNVIRYSWINTLKEQTDFSK